MEFYTRSEAAKYFKVHPRTIERWLRNGSIKGYKLGKGKHRPGAFQRMKLMDS